MKEKQYADLPARAVSDSLAKSFAESAAISAQSMQRLRDSIASIAVTDRMSEHVASMQAQFRVATAWTDSLREMQQRAEEAQLAIRKSLAFNLNEQFRSIDTLAGQFRGAQRAVQADVAFSKEQLVTLGIFKPEQVCSSLDATEVNIDANWEQRKAVTGEGNLVASKSTVEAEARVDHVRKNEVEEIGASTPLRQPITNVEPPGFCGRFLERLLPGSVYKNFFYGLISEAQEEYRAAARAGRKWHRLWIVCRTYGLMLQTVRGPLVSIASWFVSRAMK